MFDNGPIIEPLIPRLSKIVDTLIVSHKIWIIQLLVEKNDVLYNYGEAWI